MIKKRKKLLFAFIVLIILVLMITVVAGWVSLFLGWWNQQNQPNYENPAYQQAIEEAQALINTGAIQLKAKDEDGNTVNLTGNVVIPEVEVGTWS